MRSAWWCPTKMAGVKLHYYFIVWSCMINPPTEPSVLYNGKSETTRFLCPIEIRKQVKQRHQSRIRCLEDDRAVSARIARNWRRSSRTKTYQDTISGIFPAVEKWSHEGPKMVLKCFKACSNNRWSSRATPVWIVSISERTTSCWLLTNGSGN